MNILSKRTELNIKSYRKIQGSALGTQVTERGNSEKSNSCGLGESEKLHRERLEMGWLQVELFK